MITSNAYLLSTFDEHLAAVLGIGFARLRSSLFHSSKSLFLGAHSSSLSLFLLFFLITLAFLCSSESD